MAKDKSNPNIAWLVVDSVRSYKGSKDSRELLDIFCESNSYGTRFYNVQTSAPSTIMSTSAMMSGVDSIYHSITYDRFNSSNNNINYLKNKIYKKGYKTYLITFFPEGFKFLPDVFDGLTSRQSSISPPENRFWTNKEITDVINDLINKNKLEEPFLLYLNYNCRHDPNTNKHVTSGIESIKSAFNKRKLYLILNSDHGYPDPSRNLTKSIGQVGHDLIMTEDNITTPLVIVGDGFNKNEKVLNRVSLLDISDLILSITSNNLIDCKLYKLANKLDLSEKIYTTWNRYIAQENGKLCLVYGAIKCIYDIDKRKETFYKISSSMDSHFEWNLDEKPLNKLQYQENLLKINSIKKYREKEFQNVINFFSERLNNKIKDTWIIDSQTNITLIGNFAPIYKHVIENLNIKNKSINAIEVSDIIEKRYPIKPNNLRKNVRYIYIIYGYSLTRWIREMIFIFFKGYRIKEFTNYDLERPKNIVLMLKYLPGLLYSIKKSFKAWGLVNTLKIIIKKI